MPLINKKTKINPEAVESSESLLKNKNSDPTAKADKKAVEECIKKAEAGINKDALVKLFDQIMVYAHLCRASDIHLEPWKKYGAVRIRIDGILRDEFQLDSLIFIQLIARLKILTKMRTDEHHAPQDGRFKFISPLGDVDVRVSIIPTAGGEKAVLRLLSSQSHQLTLEQLGFSPEDLQRVERAVRKPWGMILATGPTGSGKTTTVYAILEVLNKREVNIVTIEDPVEFEIPGINQSQVDHVAKLTFATGLRSLLRQDPDIVMVGEIRDQETAKIAVNAAMTGHKLLSTLHTNDASTTIPRIIDMGVEPFLIASTLLCSVAQRLVRRVCDKCAGKKEFSKKEAQVIFGEEVVKNLFGDKDTVLVAEIKGCDACAQTGYHGRIGIYEVLENSPGIQEKIIRRASSAEIDELAKKEGMTSIAHDGVRKILSFQTTVEELVRVMQE
ncbi:MAG: GspE/PulE family protein [Candidatus Uhrbacteria bacterium]